MSFVESVEFALKFVWEMEMKKTAAAILSRYIHINKYQNNY